MLFERKKFLEVSFLKCLVQLTFLLSLFNYFTIHLVSLWDKYSFLRLRRIIPPDQITYTCLRCKLHILLIILFYFLVIGKNNVPVIFTV